MIFVVDTSVAVKWFVEEPEHQHAKALLLPGTEIAAPDLLLVEVANVLWRKQRGGHMTAAQVDQALEKLPTFFQHIGLAKDVVADALTVARQIGHSIYDCMFAAYASRLSDAVLVTADERFSSKLVSGGFSRLLRPLSSIAPLMDL